MDKLTMAHEYLRDIIANWEYDDSFDPVVEAWKYADAMQKEWDSRKPKGLPQALSPEVTHLNNTLAVQNMVYDDEFQFTGYEP